MEQVQQLPEMEERIQQAWSEIVKMEQRQTDLDMQVNSRQQELQEIENKLAVAKDQLTTIEAHYGDYYSKSDPSIKSKFETVVEHHSAIDQVLKTTAETKTSLEEFRDFVYGNDSQNKIGFKKELESLYSTFNQEQEKLHNDWQGAYNTLFLKIEGLLPGATATGLSKAYQDQTLKYQWPVFIWSLVFSLTVIAMMAFGIYVYVQVKDFRDSLLHILARLPFFIPAVWLAIFASRQQSQYKRLQQEYSYKETLAKSYEAYKREIDKLPMSEHTEALRESLMNSMVQMCGYNPSITLEHKSHEEKPPIPGGALLDQFKTNKTIQAEE